MIGGAQPKVLLSQAEDGTLHLDQMFEQVFGNPEKHKYKLVRERVKYIHHIFICIMKKPFCICFNVILSHP